MTFLAIPNVSEASDRDGLRRLLDSVAVDGVRLLDVHSDEWHNRSVFTLFGGADALIEAAGRLASAASYIDLTTHTGIHPRTGGLDVWPFVPYDATMDEAVAAAHAAGKRIAERAGLPVFFYGEAALREETRNLPDIRSLGLKGLLQGALRQVTPDEGDGFIDPRRGIVCVGARPPLIAFNVWIDADVSAARQIARAVRERDGGLPGVRALGLAVPAGAQVSMNLIDPETTGIDRAFEAVSKLTRLVNASITKTELVGLIPERFMPDPTREATRLLIEPGRSIEAVLAETT